MKKFLLYLFVICITAIFIIPNHSHAQMQKMPKGYNLEKFKKDTPKLLGSSNAGTEFWLTFHPNDEDSIYNNGNKIYVYVSSDVETNVTLEIPGKSYSVQKTTIPNGIIAFELDPSIAQPYRKKYLQAPEAERIYNAAGIHIYADQPIIVYGCSRFLNNSDSYLALPVSALGKEYIVASWPDIADDGLTFGVYLTSYTEVVAAYDQTKVRFTLGGTNETVTAGGQQPGQTTSWTLYKGDVLMFGSLGAFADLTGSKWEATKPVAAYSGSFGAYVPDNDIFYSFTIEAELPTNFWGKTYLYTPIAGKINNSCIRIFAKEDNTTIYRDSSKIAYINHAGGLRGDGWLSMRADNYILPPRAIVFSGDKPISVTQYNAQQSQDKIVNKPFQMALIPYEQFSKEITFNTPGITGSKDFNVNWLNIVYRTNEDGTMPDDLMFASVNDSQFVWQSVKSFSPDSSFPYSVPINGHHYACKQLLLPGDGVYKIKAINPICAYSYGFTPNDSYGNPASLLILNYAGKDNFAPHPKWWEDCMGSVWLDSARNQDAYVEDFPQDSNCSNLSTVTLDTNVSYNYGFSVKNFNPCEDSTTTWRAWVLDNDNDARAVITFTDCTGNDSTVDIIYIARKVNIRPDTDFGTLYIGDTVEKDLWIFNDTRNGSLEIIDTLKLKLNNQGFQISDFSLPVQILSPDSIKIKIKFIASQSGDFMDLIGVSILCCCDTCPCRLVHYSAKLKANVGPVSVNDNNYTKADFSLYPNPVEDNLTVQFNNERNYTLRILDIYGNLVEEISNNKGEQRINYNTSKMANGMYILQMTANKKRITKSFIILK